METISDSLIKIKSKLFFELIFGYRHILRFHHRGLGGDCVIVLINQHARVDLSTSQLTLTQNFDTYIFISDVLILNEKPLDLNSSATSA